MCRKTLEVRRVGFIVDMSPLGVGPMCMVLWSKAGLLKRVFTATLKYDFALHRWHIYIYIYAYAYIRIIAPEPDRNNSTTRHRNCVRNPSGSTTMPTLWISTDIRRSSSPISTSSGNWSTMTFSRNSPCPIRKL